MGGWVFFNTPQTASHMLLEKKSNNLRKKKQERREKGRKRERERESVRESNIHIMSNCVQQLI